MNVEHGLKVRGVGRTERFRGARGILRYAGLEEFADRFPGEILDGMQQRVSFAPVLATQPWVLLVDEPFAALDARTHLLMRELIQLWKWFRMAIVFVPHTIEEAIRRCLELLRNPKQETGSVFWKNNFPEETLPSIVPATSVGS